MCVCGDLIWAKECSTFHHNICFIEASFYYRVLTECYYWYCVVKLYQADVDMLFTHRASVWDVKRRRCLPLSVEATKAFPRLCAAPRKMKHHYTLLNVRMMFYTCPCCTDGNGKCELIILCRVHQFHFVDMNPSFSSHPQHPLFSFFLSLSHTHRHKWS